MGDIHILFTTSYACKFEQHEQCKGSAYDDEEERREMAAIGVDPDSVKCKCYCHDDGDEEE